VKKNILATQTRKQADKKNWFKLLHAILKLLLLNCQYILEESSNFTTELGTTLLAHLFFL